MADAIQISQALMIEARSDIRSAKLLLDGTEYSRSIYHSQQAVEKAMKSSVEKPIWIPSQEYTEYDANDAYKKALAILDTIIRFLKEKHNISFEGFP